VSQVISPLYPHESSSTYPHNVREYGAAIKRGRLKRSIAVVERSCGDSLWASANEQWNWFSWPERVRVMSILEWSSSAETIKRVFRSFSFPVQLNT